MRCRGRRRRRRLPLPTWPTRLRWGTTPHLKALKAANMFWASVSVDKGTYAARYETLMSEGQTTPLTSIAIFFLLYAVDLETACS